MLKRFLSFYKAEMPLFTLDMSCTVIIAAMDILGPWILKDILDRIIPLMDMSLLLKSLGLMGILALIKAICHYSVVYWGHVMGIRVEYRMRKQLFEHVHSQSFSFFDDSKSGELMSRIIDDLFQIREFIHHGPEDILLAFVIFSGTVVVMFQTSPLLAGLTSVFIPLLLFIAYFLGGRMGKYFTAMRVASASLNASLANSLAGSRVVKAYTNEVLESEKFDESSRCYMEITKNSLRSMADFFTSVNFIAELAVLVPLGAGGFLATKGQVSVGEIVMFMMYVRLFLDPIRRLSHFTEMYQRAFASFRRFHQLMLVQPEIVECSDAVDLKVKKGEIVFKNVSFAYGEKTQVFRGINLNIKPGSTAAVVGPSGGGKTTLCHLIPRFYEIDSGSLLIDGQDIRSVTLKSLREAIGIVQQEVFLFDGSIRDNIEYGRPGATEDEIIKAAEMAFADSFIRDMKDGYDTRIGERGVKLSGGQRQRISLARCFLKNPPILILDEATSALDAESERTVQGAIETLKKGRTTLIIAHRLSTVKEADNILVLVDGGLVEKGTHDQLMMKKGVYSNLYGRQSLIA